MQKVGFGKEIAQSRKEWHFRTGRSPDTFSNQASVDCFSQPDANGFGIEQWKPRLNTCLQLPNVEIEQTQFGMSRTAG